MQAPLFHEKTIIYISCFPNNLPALPKGAPARSSDKPGLATPAIGVGKCQRLRIRSPQFRKRSCSANNLSRYAWTAKYSFASTFPWRGLVVHVTLCKPENPPRASRNQYTARAGSICRAPRQDGRNGNNRPILFSDQLYDQFPLARTVVEIHVNDLLPCAECQLSIDKWDGE